MKTVKLVDTTKVIDVINTVNFSTEEQWVKFRADYGSKGVTEYIINYIKNMPTTNVVSSDEYYNYGNGDSYKKRTMGGFGSW